MLILCDLDLHFEGQRFKSRPSRSEERPFKCGECMFRCDEGNICSKTICQLTCYKHVCHLKVVLPDRDKFIQILHSTALPLKEMLRSLPSKSLGSF